MDRPCLLRLLAVLLLAVPAAAQPVSPLYATARDAGASPSDAAGLARAMRAAAPQQAKLNAFDRDQDDGFGLSVSISGETALVGAFQDSDRELESGSAYVFVRSGTAWTQQAKITASDGAVGDLFGYSVSLLSGETALVGAYRDSDRGQESGSAYVFVRSGTVWTQQAKITASDGAANDFFGWSVSLSGETALVGARQDSDAGSGSGSAYVFVRSGTAWTQQAKITASDGATSDGFGHSVSLSGETALVGAPGDRDRGQESGSAYVLVRSGTTWAQQAKLTANDGSTLDRFGWSVSLSGEAALIGAYWDDIGDEDTGSAYTFVRSGTAWAQQEKVVASDGTLRDEFGYSVSLSGATALIGAYRDINGGSAYVFAITGATADEAGTEAHVSLSPPVPNPATQRISLALTLDAPQHVRASVIDALGREVLVVLDGEASGAVRLAVDTSRLAPGVYVVRVAGTTFAETRRFTVVR